MPFVCSLPWLADLFATPGIAYAGCIVAQQVVAAAQIETANRTGA